MPPAHVAPGRPVPPAPGSASATLRRPVQTLQWPWPGYVTPGRPGRHKTRPHRTRSTSPARSSSSRCCSSPAAPDTASTAVPCGSCRPYGVLSLRADETGRTIAQQALDFPPSVLPLTLAAGAVAVDVAVPRGLPGRPARSSPAPPTWPAGCSPRWAPSPPWDERPGVVLLTATGSTLLWAALDAVVRSPSLAARLTPLEDDDEAFARGAPTR